MKTLFSWTWAEILALIFAVVSVAALVFHLVYRPAPEPTFVERMVEKHDIRRAYSGGWCTGFLLVAETGTRATADHCSRIYADRDYIRNLGVMDVLLLDGKMTERAPEMLAGESIYIIGYPARAEAPVLVPGYVRFKRDEPHDPDYAEAAWLVIFYDIEGVIDGMSGSPVFNSNDEIVGVLTASNPPTDLVGDPEPESSGYVTSLADFWDLDLDGTRQ